MVLANTVQAQGTVYERPPSMTPQEAEKAFKVAEGLKIGLVVGEPMISQPLSISFDDLGRMWVLQYLQFPNPEGLKPVEMDNWLRTKYNRVPEPPPEGPKGRDRISIYEDIDGDGRSDKVKHFLADLNLASGFALGDDGVYVAQPPYLLFYADRNHDDVPDGPPKVLLKGFGMEDAHAFANSLTWGPDGWLYGAQGSTATADIRGVGFQQGIWRYHPPTDRFELFAEGGGNTWGIDFDAFGNLFAGGNTVEPLVHHVQGAYYVKGFGKHGPLHNPHAYGYFQPVLHHGYLGDSLTGGFVLYQGGAFPERFNGACIAPNTRHSASRWSTLETRGSTFATRAAGDFITTPDIWFRPVESTVGPDGALYVADWYDYNISHSSPHNRSEWYQPSRFDGRIWRVAPETVAPLQPISLNLQKLSNEQLVELLSHPNDWFARQARRIFAERRDPSITPQLLKLIDGEDQRLALQGLWSVYVIQGLDDDLALRTLNSPHEYVRAWTVRLLGDDNKVSSPLAERFVRLAAEDRSVVVRSQLACTAKRLPAEAAMPVAAELLKHDEDLQDPHIPLLIWWAIENKAVSDADRVFALLEEPQAWKSALVQQVIAERLARRYIAEDSELGYAACARLLNFAPPAQQDLVLAGIAKALAGRKFDQVPSHLQDAFRSLIAQRPSDVQVIEIAARMGYEPAVAQANAMIASADAPPNARTTLLQVLGEIRHPSSLEPILGLLRSDGSGAVQTACLSALGYFDEPRIAKAVLDCWPTLAPAAKTRAVELLCGRRDWALALLDAVAQMKIARNDVPLPQVRQMLEHQDEGIERKVTAVWGRIKATTPLEIQGRITALSQLLGAGKGDREQGRVVFEKVCASCHQLHGRGTPIGPDLTAAERKDRMKLLQNIVEPSAVIREEFVPHIAVTTDGRVVTGLLAESKPETITLLDAKNQRTVIARSDVEELRESAVSLMPDNLLDPLTPQQIRDLFAYLQAD